MALEDTVINRIYKLAVKKGFWFRWYLSVCVPGVYRKTWITIKVVTQKFT